MPVVSLAADTIGFISPFNRDVSERVADSGVQHQRDNRDGDDCVSVRIRLAIPSHGDDRFVAAQTDLCFDWNSAWVPVTHTSVQHGLGDHVNMREKTYRPGEFDDATPVLSLKPYRVCLV